MTICFRKICILDRVEMDFFCLDVLWSSFSVYFSGRAGGRSLRARVLHMDRKAVVL